MTWLSVDLPEPFGTMLAWISPGSTASVNPCRIALSSTPTFRSFTSSNAVILFPCGLQRPNQSRKTKPGKETQRSTTGSQLAEFGNITPSRQAADQGSERANDCNEQKDRKWRKPDESDDVTDHLTYPTLPSSEIEISFCASTANSIGSCCSTSFTKPLTTRPTASSWLRPRWMQ